MIDYEEVMDQLSNWSNPTRWKINLKNGAGDKQFGVPLGDLRAYAKKIKRNHSLAMELWNGKNVDAMILATMIMDPSKITATEAKDMIMPLTFYPVLDEFVYQVIAHNAEVSLMYIEWIDSEYENLGRAGWNIAIAKILDNKSSDIDFDFLLNKIEANIKTAPFKKQESMNRCMCEIGIYYEKYRQRCIDIGVKIGRLDDRPIPKGCTSSYAPEWIAAGVKNRKPKEKQANGN